MPRSNADKAKDLIMIVNGIEVRFTGQLTPLMNLFIQARLENTIVERGRAIAVLWGEQSDIAKARNRLDQLIYRFRVTLPKSLIPVRNEEGELLGWKLAPNVSLRNLGGNKPPVATIRTPTPKEAETPPKRYYRIWFSSRILTLPPEEGLIMRELLRSPRPRTNEDLAWAIYEDRGKERVISRAFEKLRSKARELFYFSGRGRGWRVVEPEKVRVLADQLNPD